MPLQLLKACPFCGLSDIDIISPDMGETPAVSMHSYPGGFRVECEGCGCNGPWHHDHQAALDAWDSRHNIAECQLCELIPDYCNDLNAMHDAEKAMNNNDWWKFVEHLTNICGGGIALGISATARQRAEAFLRTIGKWQDAKS